MPGRRFTWSGGSPGAPTALVGAPVRVDGGRRVAVVAVTDVGAAVAYCKVHLGGDEVRHFAPGPEPAFIEVRSWRVGLGICKDTRIDDHLSRHSAKASICTPQGSATRWRDKTSCRAARIVQDGQVPVASASAASVAGPTYPRTAGRSGVWDSSGTLLAGSGPEAGSVASAVLRQ
jgi:predicted amidohydrolase